jgi:succinoglycan biosynthesis protein ExoL
MTEIAYFGHDAADAAIGRRVAALQADGIRVTGFMPRRRAHAGPDCENVDLGRTRDGAFRQRISAVLAGARKAAGHPALKRADILMARNLDMLACAFDAKRRAGIDTPVVYECLDVHRLLCRRDPVGIGLRALEGSLLKRSCGLIVSSPGFIENHFQPRHGGHPHTYLLENRMEEASGLGPRPETSVSSPEAPLKIGWVGNLRCQRSLDLLLALADRFGEAVEIQLHGAPARLEIPVFEPEIDRRVNVSFHGRYRAPWDLAELYGPLDLVWAGDFMEAGFNSVWLLPNRLYEGGYFGVPAIAPAGTQTAEWIQARGCGFAVEEPLESSLSACVAGLLEDRSPLHAAADALQKRPRSDFIAPKGEMRSMVDEILNRVGRPA